MHSGPLHCFSLYSTTTAQSPVRHQQRPKVRSQGFPLTSKLLTGTASGDSRLCNDPLALARADCDDEGLFIVL